jgi:cell division protein FtsX
MPPRPEGRRSGERCRRCQSLLVRLFLPICLGLLLATGCGEHPRRAAVETVTVTTTASPSKTAYVRIYFCTSSTCPHEATSAQNDALKNKALASPLVARVDFVSKEQQLRNMRKRHPRATAALPANPFPNTLRITPKHATDAARVASLFSGASGVATIDYQG